MDDGPAIDDRMTENQIISKKNKGRLSRPRHKLSDILSPPLTSETAEQETTTHNKLKTRKEIPREDRKRKVKEERESRKESREWKKRVVACLVNLKADVPKDYLKEIDLKMDPGGRLFTPWVLALVKHCDHSVLPKMFMSTPNQGKTVGDHAEELVLEHYNDCLAVIESINLTYSPCSSCTVLLLVDFQLKSKEKPTIKFLCVHGDANSEDRIQAFKNLELLWMYGFTFSVWCDCQNDMQHLLPTNYRTILRLHNLKMQDRDSVLNNLLQQDYGYLLNPRTNM